MVDALLICLREEMKALSQKYFFKTFFKERKRKRETGGEEGK
jgi:hypothetical protein